MVNVDEGAAVTFIGTVVATEVENVFTLFRNAGTLE